LEEEMSLMGHQPSTIDHRPSSICTTARMVAAVAALACIGAAGEAQAGFCDGKMNGYWCDGDTLKLCKNNDTASSKDCGCGCQSMPVGTDDVCKSCGGFCDGKMNGWWCDGDTLKLCKNDGEADSKGCDCGCKSMPLGTDDECNGCGSGFCNGKMNGWWCDGDALKLCKDNSEADSKKCEYGCQSMPEGVDDLCKGKPEEPVVFCTGKADGDWCDGDNLVHCQGGQGVGAQPCEFGCLKMPDGVADKCATPPQPDGFCTGKADGPWCDGDMLVQCQGGAEGSSTQCEFGCLPQPPGVADKCATPPSDPGFCASKADGHWCDGQSLTLCQGGQMATAVACANGCQWDPVEMNAFCMSSDGGNEPKEGPLTVTNSNGCGVFSGSLDLWAGSDVPVWDQTDYPNDTLGTCNGLTIGNSGCTITSLAMLYEYLGVEREVGGESGNGPVIEDAWRSQLLEGHTIGYAGTNYTSGGKEKFGECLVLWGRNPIGVALQQHENGSNSCVGYEAAVVIANSLNGGRPVVAGVHWSAGESNQHWVLIRGADAQGVLINDPWHGLAGARLDDNDLGNYVIDRFFTPFGDGIGSPEEPSGVYDEQGKRLEDEETATPVPIVVEAGFPIAGDEDATIEEYTTGCGISRGGGTFHAGWGLGLAVVLAALLAVVAVLPAVRGAWRTAGRRAR